MRRPVRPVAEKGVRKRAASAQRRLVDRILMEPIGSWNAMRSVQSEGGRDIEAGDFSN